MAFNYYPRQGDVLQCDFTRGFVAPEMLKIRKVVVISPTTSHRRKLCTVVPISSTAPDHEEDWHYLLRTNPRPLGWLPPAVGQVRHDLHGKF